MEIPLWYKVFKMGSSYLDFTNHQNKNFSIFILSSIYDHDPYIDSAHVLHQIMNVDPMPYSIFRCIYLYWALRPETGFVNDLINRVLADDIKFNNITIKIAQDFGEHDLINWINMIVMSLFKIGPISITYPDYDRHNLEHLKVALQYTDSIQKNRFSIVNLSVSTMYRLAKVHAFINEIRQWLRGKRYPSFLTKYRFDPTFVSKIISSYWPQVLHTLTMIRPFDQYESIEIKNAHEKLHRDGNVGFLFDYVTIFTKTFGPDDPLSIHLNSLLKPSRQNDKIMVKRFLLSHDNNIRTIYLPQLLPISDYQVDLFANKVEEVGFEAAFMPYVEDMKAFIEREALNHGMSICNPTCFSTQVSIYMYSLSELVFYPNERQYYIFTKEEIINLSKDKKNPYTNKELGEDLFKNIPTNHESQSYLDIWSQVLRHELDL